MGIIADSFVTYAQPLFDETDGTKESFNRAMTVAQMCWNFAIMPEDRRDAAINDIKPALKMSDAEFAEFRQHVILPMIQRHCEMFPGLHTGSKHISSMFGEGFAPEKKKQRTGRNAPCPCGSGRKYKRCCGASR
ncbi:MAG: SEC-C domain-containing protein [Pirellulales bacterium]|nr:SEC-C domain-containing protein [Pirellulales bacterium]